MSKLSELPKTSSFSSYIEPDGKIASTEVAAKNEDGIINKPRILSSGGFSYSLPELRKEYRFLTANEAALNDLGLDPEQVNDKEFQELVSGEFYLMYKDTFQDKGYPFPYSQAYAGWQFGQFAGQLGDGRVVNLFEVPKAKVQSNNRHKYEVQLKGSGKTPYSRFADGKAVLRSSIREYIISEHLNAIGIPTTRALSLTYLPATYAQRHAAEKCAIVSRFAESWIRLGTFDLYRWRGDRSGIRKLSDYVIDELFTVEGTKFCNFENLLREKSDFFDNTTESLGELTDYDKMYYETIVRNATTTALTQSYGFLNGVLNTDNTSILGLTMDFGPFSIMDKYSPTYTPNSEDHEQRYGYRNTPTAIWWNLTRLGEDLAELIGAGSKLLSDPKFERGEIDKDWEDAIIKRATKIIEIGGDVYQYAFTKKYVETFFARLGISPKIIDYTNIDKHNVELIAPLLEVLYKVKCDYNKFFLILQDQKFDAENYNPDAIADNILAPSYDENDNRYSKKELTDEIKSWLGVYRAHLEESRAIDPTFSRLESKKYNPVFLPRNWILDQVIAHVQDSGAYDLSYLKKLERMSFYPFDSTKWGDDLKELEQSWLLQGDKGEDYSMLQCSCAS
ncbi:predicted protein [Scheffersomyces stipitis CBS 6054]|uniref:Selenoprotein O n=1 Tax=Scheffersomyces stipitis (strain ATCC 58785 / CBS 6054 / NBRC 10063 / NRRL Y-11545) TaxID=322104 RepID=A3LRU3_PICST|nr:predicted protein [Scheffersomyces stipitis CBS 6054]ABN65792.2 predicted protein [Scheffersomyces stipitis CBS 6054]KAG2733823.1 hypothetical protein G9P44_003348 [Scheffersomyces stipitis]